MDYAETKATPENKPDLVYYANYFRKIVYEQEGEVKQSNEATDKIVTNREDSKSKFVFARDLFNLYYKTGQLKKELNKKQQTRLKAEIYTSFASAAEGGIYEAFYYLGCFHLEEKAKYDPEEALFFLSIAAAHSHGLALFKLYEMFYYKQTQSKWAFI